MTLTLYPGPQPYHCIRQPPLTFQCNRHGLIFTQLLSGHRSSINAPPRSHMLTSPPNNSRQPEPHTPGTNQPSTGLHHPTCLPSNLPHYSLWRYRDHYVLRDIRSHPDPHPRDHHPMRQPGRAFKCRHLFPILHPSWLTPTFSCALTPAKQYRNSIYLNTSICQPHRPLFLWGQAVVSRLSIGISSKNTTLWCPSLTSQSPRRSPNRRLNDPCGRLTKTWGIRHNAYDNCPRTSH